MEQIKKLRVKHRPANLKADKLPSIKTLSAIRKATVVMVMLTKLT